MNRVKIGICLASLGLPLRRGLAEAERMGVTGVRVDAVGELSPKTLSQTGRREFLHLLRSYNLELCALNCPLRHGLDTAEGQDLRIEHVQRVLSLSFDLGARLVTIAAGSIPEKLDEPRGLRLTEAFQAIGRYGDRTGTVLAVESGAEEGKSLRGFLERFDTGSLAVNLDPANFVVNGLDPYENTRALQGKAAFAHAKDARKTAGSRVAQEVALGHGEIDWMRYLSVLEEIEYRNWLTIVSRSSEQRTEEVAVGVKFLKRLMRQDG